MIQDLFGSWCIKGTGESTLVINSPVPLMHHDPDRCWITDPDPDHPKGTQPQNKKSPPVQTERVKEKRKRKQGKPSIALKSV